MRKQSLLYCLFFIIISSSLLLSCENNEMEKVILDNEDPVVTVENVSPLSGYISTEIAITGTEFGMMADAVTVYIGETELEIISCEENKIVARVPQGTTSGKISVDVFGQRVDTEFLFDVLGEPGITDVNPVYGFIGDEITFTGHNLGVPKSNYNILFAGTEKTAEILGTPENEKIIVKVPEHAISGKIKLEIFSKNVSLPFTNGFTVLQHATVTSMVSTEGYAGGNIEIIGKDLSPELLEKGVELKPIKVTLNNGVDVIELEANEETDNEKIVAKLPDDISVGEYIVSVSTPFEDIITDSQLKYTIKEKPSVIAVTPAEAHVGTIIKITCKNIEGITTENVKVMFGETLGSVVSVSEGVISVKVPQLDAGTYDLKLIISGLDIELGENSQFEVLKTPKIISVSIEELLHNESMALVASGTELVVSGEGFGTNQDVVNLIIGETPADITSINDGEIRFTVPATFNEGKISMKFSGIDVSLEYSAITFKLLIYGTDITEYVMKNYKAPFIPDGDDMQRSGEWMKPLNWIVENGTTDGMVGFGLQLGTRYDKTTGATLALQTDWGFPLTMTDGKIYQNVDLVPGKYKLIAHVLQYDVTGSSYLAISDNNFNVETGNINSTSLENSLITQAGDSSMEFTISKADQYSVGFVATLTTAKKFIKVQSFKLIYEGTSSN